MKNGIPIISQLLRAVIVEDYAKAVEIITDKDFDPNERNSSWGSPVLSTLITVISDNEKIHDKQALKEILKDIVKNEKFDPNIVDIEGETVLMRMARHPSFNWLAPFILCKKELDLSIKNFRKNDAIDIAEKCGNTVLADILLSHKANNHNGMPKKRVGIKTGNKDKKNHLNVNILERIEYAFDEAAKKNPVSLYNLLVNFFSGKYSECIQIVKDVNFNPNERDKWEEPALSSLIYYSQDSTVGYDEKEFEKIADAIIGLPKFNVNEIDSDCNTILMVSMGFPKLHWLTEKLFNIQSVNFNVVNDLGENVREIADKCGDYDFYKYLVNKSFEMAKAI